MEPAAIVKPNLYTLNGIQGFYSIHVTYSTSGFDGKAHFSYQDMSRARAFSGDEIRSVDTEIGTLVSVTFSPTADQGSTTFSVLLPRVNLIGERSVSISVEGITTLHRETKGIIPLKSSIVPSFGQLDLYQVIPLSGTASQVSF